jgi:hypothetical protein
MLSLAAILRRFPAMPRVMRRALLAPLALSCFAHAATPRAASRDIGSAPHRATSAPPPAPPAAPVRARVRCIIAAGRSAAL